MKKVLVAAAALGLLTASASADPWNNDSEPAEDNSIGDFNQVIEITQIGVINLGIAAQARFGEVEIETDGEEFLDLDSLEEVYFQGAIYAGGDVDVPGVLFADDVDEDVQIATTGGEIDDLDECAGIGNCDNDAQF